MRRERQDIVAAFAQRRQVNRNDVETVVEVLAKAPGLDLLKRVPVGGADQAHVDLETAIAADRLDRPGLGEAQQLGLQGGIHVADFVQEQGAAVGQLGGAVARRSRAGVGALGMAEDLAFHQFLGDRPAIDRDEGPVPARARLVNRLGADLLAAAALSGDEDGGLAGRGVFDNLIEEYPAYLTASLSRGTVGGWCQNGWDGRTSSCRWSLLGLAS